MKNEQRKLRRPYPGQFYRGSKAAFAAATLSAISV